MAGESREKDKQPTAPEAAKEAAKEAKAERSEETPVYPRDLLISGGLTDYAPHEVAGALAGLGATPANLSIDEANAAVKAWLESPVKQEA
jgi:hypothetical protein